MRLVILGAGSIGGYFGGRLAKNGVDVTFLVRPGRAERLAREGLVIRSPLGDATLKVRFATQADGAFDAVLVSCKAYDLEGAIDAIEPAVGPETLVLPLLNGLRHYETLDARFGPDRVLGGLAHIGVTMTSDGVVRHLNTLQRFILGARSPDQAEAAAALYAELAKGGFKPILSDDVDQATWDKYVLLAAFAGLTCLMRAPVGAIMRAQDGEAIANAFIAECAGVAEAAGRRPSEKVLADTRAMMTAAGSPNTASMLRDLESGGRTEHEHIFGDMLDRARAARQDAPMLTLALAQMQAYEARRATAAA